MTETHNPTSPHPSGLACCELRYLADRDPDLEAGPGVSAGPGLAVCHREAADVFYLSPQRRGGRRGFFMPNREMNDWWSWPPWPLPR